MQQLPVYLLAIQQIQGLPNCKWLVGHRVISLEKGYMSSFNAWYFVPQLP